MEKSFGKSNYLKTLNITANASGAVEAARRQDLVMIVDVIDMSTAAEAVLEAGSLEIFGASPDSVSIPLKIAPEKIGFIAAKRALKHDVQLIIIAEPRIGKEERKENITQVASGIDRAGGKIDKVVPNVGAQVTKLAEFQDKVVILVTNSGGVAFDAAYNYGAPKVITGTVARTLRKKGVEPAQAAAERAIKFANEYSTGISLVAATSNSYEDILAVEKIGELIVDADFLSLKPEYN